MKRGKDIDGDREKRGVGRDLRVFFRGVYYY